MGITASSPIFVNQVSQEKEVTVNAAPPEPLYNQQPESIHLQSPIRTKQVSLDKGPDREFSAAGIMTKSTGGLSRHPGKRKSLHQKKVSMKSATAVSYSLCISSILC